MDKRMTKEQLIKELESLRRKVARLEAGQSGDEMEDAQALQEAHNKLDGRARKPTARLSKPNNQLNQEIAEHKVTAEALELSRRWFSLIYQSSPHAINVARARDGAIIDANPSCLRRWGYSREEVIGRTVSELGLLVDPQDWKESAEGLLEEEGEFHNYESQIRTKSGEIRYILGSFAIIELDGESCILSVSEDITDRKQAEEALRQSEARFSRIFSTNAVGINIARLSDRVIIDANDRSAQIRGYSREEMVGQTVESLRLVDEPVTFEKEVQPVLEKEGVYHGFETQIRTKAGETRDILSSFAIIELDGEPCILAATQDISPLKQAQEALRQSEARFSQIFSTNAVAINITRLSDGVILDVNDRVAQHWGYSREELIGNTVSVDRQR